jgi:hypothetical protein
VINGGAVPPPRLDLAHRGIIPIYSEADCTGQSGE